MSRIKPTPAISVLCALLLSAARACYLQGYDSGKCVTTGGGNDYIFKQLPFCSQYVKDYPSVCVPIEYDYFPNHTVRAKDKWINKEWADTVERRKAIEEKNGDGFTLGALRPFAAPACHPRWSRPTPSHPFSHARAHPHTRTPSPFSSSLRARQGQDPHTLLQKQGVPGGLRALPVLHELPPLRPHGRIPPHVQERVRQLF